MPQSVVASPIWSVRKIQRKRKFRRVPLRHPRVSHESITHRANGVSLLQQQIVKRILVLPAIRMKVSFVSTEDTSLSALFRQEDERCVRKIHGQVRGLAHQFTQSWQVIGPHGENSHTMRCQRLHPIECLGDPDLSEHEMDTFHQHGICRDQRLAITSEKISATRVVGVASIRQGQPSSGVHQDHGSIPSLE